MAKTRNRRTVEDAASHCIDGTRCNKESRGLGETMPTRPRVLIVGADEQVGYPPHQALEAEYDARWASSLDGSRGAAPRDLDMTVLDWSILSRIGLKTAYDDCERDACEDLSLSVDLKAVRRLGTILKRLSARSRARRRSIN